MQQQQQKGSKRIRVYHQFICPITQEVMKHPVIAEDGVTYEKDAISTWLKNHSTSPMTRERISATKLIPNIALKQLIDQWRQQEVKKLRCQENQPRGEQSDDEEENERWRVIDEVEFEEQMKPMAAIEGDTTTEGRREDEQGASEQAEHTQQQLEGTNEEVWGWGEWLAVAGGAALVAAGGIAMAVSASTGRGINEEKKEKEKEESCCIS